MGDISKWILEMAQDREYNLVQQNTSLVRIGALHGRECSFVCIYVSVLIHADYMIEWLFNYVYSIDMNLINEWDKKGSPLYNERRQSFLFYC